MNLSPQMTSEMLRTQSETNIFEATQSVQSIQSSQSLHLTGQSLLFEQINLSEPQSHHVNRMMKIDSRENLFNNTDRDSHVDILSLDTVTLADPHDPHDPQSQTSHTSLAQISANLVAIENVDIHIPQTQQE